MRIFVTGGAGLVGRAVVEQLSSRGHEIVSLVRRRSPAPLPPGVSEEVADARDADAVDAFMDGADAVVHLAAIPAPGDRTTLELVNANSLATLAVLEAAGRRGVSPVVIASSISALGMAWSDELMHPLVLPVGEDHPLRPTEGYGLSKEIDEAAARMAARRWGTTVIAMRLPFTGTAEMLRERSAARDTATELSLAKELWGYLDVRDAAAAVELALRAARDGRVSGAHVLNICADDVLPDEPLAALTARWHPNSPITGEVSRGAYATRAAEALIGFRATHLLVRGSSNTAPAGHVDPSEGES
jgi:nucleoside-diphosphate-sugar epimerase